MSEDFSAFFQDFGITATLAGCEVTGIMDLETFDEGPGALTQRTTFLMKPEASVTPIAGQQLAVGVVTYKVRQVLLEPPDGALQRLVLARA